jgi:hypothetical protein
MQDTEEFRSWLKDLLSAGEVTVSFEKKDSTPRVMRCTTSAALIPPAPVVEGTVPRTRKANPDVVAVYDLDLAQWRSFRWTSIKEVILVHQSPE